METVNAIAKARFASARPQRVHLHRGAALAAELVCLEPSQEIRNESGAWCYYVVRGSVTLAAGGPPRELSMGHAAATEAGEKHRLRNESEQRAICLAVAAP